MDLFKMFAISGAGMSAQRSRMSVISGNLANAETSRTPEGGPYRRRDVVLRVPLAGRFDTLADTLDPDSACARRRSAHRCDRAPRRNFDPKPSRCRRRRLCVPAGHQRHGRDGGYAVGGALYEANLTVYNATKNLVRRLLEVG
jgi:flagellar basal-body rod protein FlgC